MRFAPSGLRQDYKLVSFPLATTGPVGWPVVSLTNIATQTSNSAVIVWKGNERPEGGWEYGVELVAPEMDFWGLEL